MNFILVVSLFYFAIETYAQRSDDTCQFREKFVSQSKVSIFETKHNEFREAVARGKLKNDENHLQTASNMNYLTYNQDMARRAQDCADRCPVNEASCHNLAQGNGVLVFNGDVYQGGADWFPERVIHHWAGTKNGLRQLTQADASRFGCGRVQANKKSILSEVVVCFYDGRPSLNGATYKAGAPGSSCLYGRKSGYLGLCNSGRNLLVHQNHKVKNHSKNHKKHRKQKQK